MGYAALGVFVVLMAFLTYWQVHNLRTTLLLLTLSGYFTLS